MTVGGTETTTNQKILIREEGADMITIEEVASKIKEKIGVEAIQSDHHDRLLYTYKR
jgi:hypothetical protein